MPKDYDRLESVGGQPYHLYMAECKDCLIELEEILKPIRREYTAAVFCSALLALLMKSVSAWKGSSSETAMRYIRNWAETWEKSFNA